MKNEADLINILEELEQLLLKKHKDYGPLNISNAPGGAMNGLRVRMHDKMARLNHLIDSGDTPNYESLEDTLLDLANYAIIGLLVQRNQWAGTTTEVKKVNVKDIKQAGYNPERPANSIPQSQNSQWRYRVHK